MAKKNIQINKLRSEQAWVISEDLQLRRLCAKDAMIKPVFVFPDDDSATILKKLKREHVNVCIVITKERHFVGEISDEDIIRLFMQQVRYEPLVEMLDRGYRRDFVRKKAKEMINKHQSVVELHTPINRVIELVWKEGFQYIPVLDKKKRVVGVVTPSSLIDLLEDH